MFFAKAKDLELFFGVVTFGFERDALFPAMEVDQNCPCGHVHGPWRNSQKDPHKNRGVGGGATQKMPHKNNTKHIYPHALEGNQ